MNDDSIKLNDEDILEEEYVFEETGIDWTGVEFVNEGMFPVIPDDRISRIRNLVNYVDTSPVIKSFSLEEVCESLRLEFDF